MTIRFNKNLFINVIFVLVCMAAVGCLVWSGIYLYQKGESRHQVAWFVGGLFMAVTVPLSVFQIVEHLRNYHTPKLQKFVVRILWMVPIYSVDAWLSLRFKEAAPYINTARECYEAYVIYCFVALLVAFLGTEQEIIEKIASHEPEQQKHIFPMNFIIPRWTRPKDFLRRCVLGAFQYVVIRVTTTLLSLILLWADVYEQTFSPKQGYLYLTIINNVSQVWAMYCLVLFYHGMAKELKPLKPIGKFISVKMVVFFSFWQSIVIAALVHFNVIEATLDYSTKDIAEGLQAFIITIEMFVAAMCHRFVFPVSEFTVEGAQSTFLEALLDATVPHDMVDELDRVKNATARKVKFPMSKISKPGAVASPSDVADGEGEGYGAMSVTPTATDDASQV